MIRVNLLPTEEAERVAEQRQQLAVGALVLTAFALFFVVAHSWQGARLLSARRQLDRLNQELGKIQGAYADVTKLEAQKKELADKLRVIGNLEAKKVGAVNLLEELSAATPDRLWLTEFTDTGGTVRIAGLGVDEQTVADFLRALSTTRHFHGIDLEEASLVEKSGRKHKRFVLRGRIDYAGVAPAEVPAKPNPTPGEAGR